MSLEYIFTRIKPACENFLKSSTTENLNALKNVLDNDECPPLDNFLQHTLLPLVLKLDNLEDRPQSELKHQLIDCITTVISKVHFNNLNALKTMLIVIINQIYDFNSGIVKSDLSEEMKLAALKCVTEILNKTNVEVLEKFYTPEHSTTIGKIAVICVYIINHEKYKKLRLAAVECLMQSFYVHDEADFNDIVLRNEIANTVFLFLPKIAQTLFKVAIGDEIQGELLISTSIKALGRILCLIYQDYSEWNTSKDYQICDFLELIRKQQSSTQYNQEVDYEVLGMRRLKNSTISTEEKFKKLQSTGRTEQWLSASSRILKNSIFNSMVILRANPSFSIRREYAEMCANFLRKCSKNLKENFCIFLESLIALSQDEYVEIRKLSNECINDLKNTNPYLRKIFQENSEEIFTNCLKRLPRIIHRCDETEQLAEFLFLKGFIQVTMEDSNCAGNFLKRVLTVPGHLEKFCMCLLTILDMKLDEKLLLEEYTLRDVTENVQDKSRRILITPWRRFKYCDDNNYKVIQVVEDIFKLLRNSEVVQMIFDHLMELLSKHLSITNEIILSLTLLLGGECDFKLNCGLTEFVHILLDELLENYHWTLELKPNNTRQPSQNTRWFVDRTPGLYESGLEVRTTDICPDEDDEDFRENFISVADAKFNVLHTCVVLDAIGNLSLTLQQLFQNYMYRVLQKILTKASSSNFMIFRAANYALNCIKTSLGYDTVNNLLKNYSDYISFHINYFIKKDDQCEVALNILNAIFQYDCINRSSEIYLIINTLLEELTKIEQLPYVSLYLKVFHNFILHVQKQLRLSCEEDFELIASNTVNNDDDLEDLYNKMIESLKQTNETFDEPINLDMPVISDDAEEANNLPSEQQQNEDIEMNEDKEKDNELPEYIRILIKLFKEILKFISSKEQMHKILSMECLVDGLPILKCYENEFLPIVHEIWYPFVERFKEKDPVVMSRCFDLLLVLCVNAKEFLHHRTLKDIIPCLNTFLRESSKNNQKEYNLIYTQEYKLQCRLLKYYSELIISMGIDGKDLDEICDIVIIYLSNKQPKGLQEYAVKYFINILTYNKPLVYLKLAHFENKEEFRLNISVIFDEIIR